MLRHKKNENPIMEEKFNSEELSNLVNMMGDEDDDDGFVSIGDDDGETGHTDQHFEGFTAPHMNGSVYDEASNIGGEGTNDPVLNPLGNVDASVDESQVHEISGKSRGITRSLKHKSKKDRKDDGKKAKKFGKRSKKSDQGASDFTIIGDGADSDFVIIENKSEGIGGALRRIFGAAFAVILFAFLTFSLYFCLSYKMIPERISGYNWYINGVSVISNNYQPNIDELQVGDRIIVIDDNKEWIPFQFSYNRYEYQSRNGAIIYVETESGEKMTIESVDIDYVVKMNR